MAKTFKLNTSEFNRAAELYSKALRKSLPEAINRKMAWITRKSLWYTPKADYGKMAKELGQKVRVVTKTNKRTGKEFTTLTAKKGKAWLGYNNSASTAKAPLLALIINKIRGQRGQRGLYGDAMRAAFEKMFAYRARSIAFLKSGWLPALDAFRAFSGGGKGARGLPPVDKTAKQFKQPKGGGRIATPSNPTAVIWNTASTKRDHKKALLVYGMPALQKAYNEEVDSMKEYMERKFREDAQRIGIKTN